MRVDPSNDHAIADVSAEVIAAWSPSPSVPISPL
jgi:hypothetical protein